VSDGSEGKKSFRERRRARPGDRLKNEERDSPFPRRKWMLSGRHDLRPQVYAVLAEQKEEKVICGDKKRKKRLNRFLKSPEREANSRSEAETTAVSPGNRENRYFGNVRAHGKGAKSHRIGRTAEKGTIPKGGGEREEREKRP